MNALIVLREMWQELRRRPMMVAVVLVAAVLAGCFVALKPGFPPKSREYQVWIASVDVLVDTSDTQVVDAKGPDPVTLANRASLLGNLVATEPLTAAIGKAAGVPADRLVVVPPAPPTDGVPITPPPVAAGPGRKIPDADAEMITISTDETVPILHIATQAPDATTASRLASGTLDALERHLDTVAARDKTSPAHELVVRQLAVRPPLAVTRGTSPVPGVAVAILLAFLGLGAIAAVPMVGRRWRQAEAMPSDNGRPAPSPEPAILHEAAAPPESAAPHDSAAPFDPTIPSDRAAHRGQAHADSTELTRAAVAAVSDPTPVEVGASSRSKKPTRRGRKHGRQR